MTNISLTTNVDLQNYASRVDTIAKHFKPLGIEIFSLPQNYQSKQQLELPEKQESSGYALLSKELARDIGRKIKANGIPRVQFHYPWQQTLLDKDGHDLALTFQFCDEIKESSGAERFTINYHNVLKYPSPRQVESMLAIQREPMPASYRRHIHRMLDVQAVLSQLIKRDLNSEIDLIVENNPATSVDVDKKTGQNLLDNTDLVPEDYIGRLGIDGTNLDYSHAWTVVEGLIGDKKQSNLEWCKRHYGVVPESARSIERFVKAVSPRVKWVHLSDELNAYSHEGLHAGDGKIDLKKCLCLLNSHLTKETPATIEVKDGYTPEGFKKILEQDLPVLSALNK